MIHHADIPAGENRRAPLVLFNGHRFVRPRPLMQGVCPSARLAARAAVRTPPRQEAGQHAPPRIRHARRAVNERFQLDFIADRRAHRLDLVERHLPRQHDALRPQRLVYPRGFAVRRARLRAYVNIQSRCLPRNPRDRAKVGDDRRIHTHVARRLRRAHHAVKVAVKGKNVERQIDLSARRMRQRDSLLKLLFVKIPGLCAQAVLFRATINGASAPKRSAV